MSYTGFGVVGIVAAAKPTAVKAALLPSLAALNAAAVARLTSCRGGPAQKNHYWERSNQVDVPRGPEGVKIPHPLDAVSPLLEAERKKLDPTYGGPYRGSELWHDRFFEEEIQTESWNKDCGSSCSSTVISPSKAMPRAALSNQICRQDGTGRPSDPRSWPSGAWKRIDPDSYRFWQEDRVRVLLGELSAPAPGFKNILERLAYDASFCGPVTVSFRLDMAVRAARKSFDKRFPRSRWKLIPNVVSVTCIKKGTFSDDFHEQTSDGWRENRKVSDVCQSVVTTQPWGIHRQTFSLVPVGYYRLHPMQVLSVYGGRIVPTKWFADLLNCLAPGWQQYRQIRTFALPKAGVR